MTSKAEIVEDFKHFLNRQPHLTKDFKDSTLVAIVKIVRDMDDSEFYVEGSQEQVFIDVLQELNNTNSLLISSIFNL